MKALLASFVVLAALSGCAPSGSASTDPPPSSIKPIDQTVLATVKMNLKTDPDLAASNLDVKAENGLVVLRGTVPSQEARKRAEDIAKKSAKVEKVANHLEVSE